jgi:hypothetical protein
MRGMELLLMLALSQCCLAQQTGTTIISGSAFSKEAAIRYDGVAREIVVIIYLTQLTESATLAAWQPNRKPSKKR